jgi:hypothetical protein
VVDYQDSDLEVAENFSEGKEGGLVVVVMDARIEPSDKPIWNYKVTLKTV